MRCKSRMRMRKIKIPAPDEIRRAFICNVRQLNRLIQFHLSAFSFRGYHANIISNCTRLIINLREYIAISSKNNCFSIFSSSSSILAVSVTFRRRVKIKQFHRSPNTSPFRQGVAGREAYGGVKIATITRKVRGYIKCE